MYTVNTALENATVEQLAKVENIGLAIAKRIKANGPYESWADMCAKVRGLGEKNGAELFRLLELKVTREQAKAKAKARAGVGSTRCYAVIARKDGSEWVVQAGVAWKQSDVEEVHTSLRETLLDWMKTKPGVDFVLRQISLGLYKRIEKEGAYLRLR
jgi:hypothetical protein